MELLAAGCHASLDELYGRYAARLLAYFVRMLDRDGALAQDFLQDLFLKVVERPELFDTRRSFRAWVYTIAHNMCRNERRRRGVRRAEAIDADTLELAGIPHDVAVDLELFSRALDAELATLDTAMQTTFLLRYQEGLSIREIATIVEVPEGTVKSRLFNCTRRLARRLEAFDPDAGSGSNTQITAGRYA